MRKFVGLILVCSLLTTVSCNYFRGGKKEVKQDGFLYIRTGAGFEEVMDSLSDKLNRPEDFEKYAVSKDYPSKIKAGKYKLSTGDTNKEILNRLILGSQAEVPLMIGNEPTIFHLAGKVSKKIEADSAQIVNSIIVYGLKQNPQLGPKPLKFISFPIPIIFSGRPTANNLWKECWPNFKKFGHTSVSKKQRKWD